MLRAAPAACVMLAALARAAAGDPSDAERLFREGRTLLDAGRPVEACAKFEQSLAKDPRQVGVLMNLGRCNERAGKIATAVQLYREARDRAREANLTGAHAAASAEIDRLLPEVPVLALIRSAAPVAGEKLVLDDAVIPNDRAEVPLDPGRHAVVVTAPGRLPFETTVTLARAEHAELHLPALEVPAHTVMVAGASSRRLIGTLATFGGVATGLVAGGLAIYARRDYDALFAGATPHCGGFPRVSGEAVCDDVGQSRSSRDHKLGTAALITGAAGAALAVTGAVLWLTAPGDTRLAPTVTSTGAGVVVRGAF